MADKGIGRDKGLINQTCLKSAVRPMQENRYEPVRLWNRYFVFIWLVAFFLQIGQNLYNSTISLYVTSMGMSATFAGSIAVPYAVMAITARIMSGYITDKMGRRLGMLLGCGAFCLGSFLFGLPALAFPAAMLLTRALHGFGYACASTSYSTAVVDVTPPRQLSLGLGVNWTAQGISQAICGVLVILLIRGDNFTPLFVFATLALGLGVLFSALCGYETPRAAGRKEKLSIDSLFEKTALPYALILLVFYGGIALTSLFVLSFASQRGYQNASLFFVMFAIGMTCSNIVSVKLADRFGGRRVVGPVYLAAAAGVAMIGLGTSYLLYLFAGIIVGFSMGVVPVIQGAAVGELPAAKKGAGTSTLFLTMDIAMGIGPLIWGAVIDGLGYESAFAISAAVIVCAGVLAFMVFKREKGSRG